MHVHPDISLQFDHQAQAESLSRPLLTDATIDQPLSFSEISYVGSLSIWSVGYHGTVASVPNLCGDRASACPTKQAFPVTVIWFPGGCV